MEDRRSKKRRIPEGDNWLALCDIRVRYLVGCPSGLADIGTSANKMAGDSG